MLAISFWTCAGALSAQIKPHLQQIKKNEGPAHRLEDLHINPVPEGIPAASRPFGGTKFNYRSLPPLVAPRKEIKNVQVMYADRSDLPVAIYGEAASAAQFTDPEARIFAQLAAVKEYLRIEDPENEFEIVAEQEGRMGYRHYKLQQYYRDVPVYGGELMVHLQNGEIRMLNGRHFATPTLPRTSPAWTTDKAIQKAIYEVSSLTTYSPLPLEQQKMLGLEASKSELVVYHRPDQPNRAVLAWRVELVPNIHHREVYFLDANTGDVLFHQGLLCKLHEELLPPTGPATGTETDLLGQNRTIHSYEVNGTFALIDVSRPMFNNSIQFDPADPKGSIWTLDAKNETPIENDDFQVEQITSNNKNTWPAGAVSAHYNAGEAYEYFRTTFGRNSINGRGGTILSIINVADEDGSSLQNAFWSGSAMFYGNGGNAFSPLARALDVAGHEMSHGVVQTTANLEYLSQSGALNESFADIFGAMIDREDWKIGEDVVKTNFFPSGALRDLSNPNNGTNNPNNNGWQPAHMNQYVDLPETEEGDNGGVHVNSGIPNRAFYLFATAVGREVAEQVYYNALNNYLTRLSQFVDLRIAVLASAGELYNNTVVNAAASAFDQVGIVGNQGTDQPDDLESNSGQEIVLFANANQQTLNLYTYGGQKIAEPLFNDGVMNKPSISDDGTRMVYIDGDQNIKLVDFNWAASEYNLSELTNDGSWRTAAISKDGQLLAALTNDFDDKLYIFRLSDGEGVVYTLYNPTSAEGITTGTVAYADILEWSLNGRSVMYDAKSTISKVDGTIEFWDIGFIDVWDTQAERFGNGFISKLFTGLPEGVSVGNPTFSKNSPFIISLDYIDETEGSYSILGVNALTNEIGEIFSSSDLGFPNYSVDDDKIVFDGFNQSGNRVLGHITLAQDKINADGNAVVLLSGSSGARWGIVFATGQRDLTSDIKDPLLRAAGLTVYPNPTRSELQIELENTTSDLTNIRLFDQLGRQVYSDQQVLGTGTQKFQLSMKELPAGTYILDIRQSAQRWLQRVIKQ